MIPLLGMLCVIAVFNGGAQFNADHYELGLGLTALGTLGLGTIVAAIQSSNKGDRFDTRDGMNVRQLCIFIAEHAVDPETKVYVGDTGLNLAACCFSCLLDGGKALVIERKAEPGTAAAVAHDLF